MAVVAMAPCQGGKALDGAAEIGIERIDAGAKREHGRGVDDVLARRAPMHVARGLRIGLADIGRERLDQGNREIAGSRRGLAQSGHIKAISLARGFDRAHRGCGNHIRGGLGACQGCLEIEHVLEG
ncbi:hypothetical protein ACVWZ3_005177 [Bradyrhizobium sp. i1.3.6]